MSLSQIKLPHRIARRTDLSWAGKKVLASIYTRRRMRYPHSCGLREIAGDWKLRESTVAAAVRELERAGVLRVTRHGERQATEYTVTAPDLEPWFWVRPRWRKGERRHSLAGIYYEWLADRGRLQARGRKRKARRAGEAPTSGRPWRLSPFPTFKQAGIGLGVNRWTIARLARQLEKSRKLALFRCTRETYGHATLMDEVGGEECAGVGRECAPGWADC